MENIDRIVATDVVYAAVVVDKLAKLIRAIKDRHPRCVIEVMIPHGRSTQNAFLDSMVDSGFQEKLTNLNDPIYRAQVLTDVIQDMKQYPTLRTQFDYYVFENVGSRMQDLLGSPTKSLT